MLKTKKLFKVPLVAGRLAVCGLFLFQYLIFIPEQSYATTSISTVTPTTPVTEWDDLEYMQQMTLEACNSASVNDTKRLTDSRDGKTYWVTKLKDNQCWMTQNLDLDLNGVTLKPDDSNVSSDWVSDTGPSTIDGYDASNYYRAQYYDPGNKYCNTSNCDATTSSNDGHDHQGNLYSWTAATAGVGKDSNITSGDVDSSICPRGWQLPTSGPDNTEPKSFGGLTTAYSVSNNAAGSTTLRDEPLYFIYSGVVDSDSLNNAGRGGYYWSSTPLSSTNAYSLGLISSNAYSSDSRSRYFGRAVRCVASDTSSEPTSGISSPNISVNVPNIITLDVYSNNTDDDKTVDISTNFSTVSTGTFTAKVTSNANYNILLNATNEGADATSLIGHDEDGTLTGHSIPTLATNSDGTYTQPQKGVSSWGIRTCISPLESSCDAELYKPLPTKSNSTAPNPFYTGTPSSDHQTLFQIGIGVSPDLPSGTYTTDILVTAATTD